MPVLSCAESGDIRIVQEDVAELAEDAHHLLGRRVLRGLGKPALTPHIARPEQKQEDSRERHAGFTCLKI